LAQLQMAWRLLQGLELEQSQRPLSLPLEHVQG
jgi:hypothetical protein